MKKTFPLFVAAVFFCQLSTAQNVKLSPTVIASAGAYSEAGNISLSWTLGELAVSTLSQGGITLSQGFQQAYLPETGFHMDPIQWQIIAYPNPVNEKLNIQFDLPEATDFLIEIQDITGRIISQNQFKQVYSGDIIPVEMSSFKSGTYFFRISSKDRQQVRVINISKI